MKLVILSIILLIFSVSYCSNCVPGTVGYKHKDEQHQCRSCNAGHFCPTFDGAEYACEDGYYAPGPAFTSCVPCKSLGGKTNKEKSLCFLGDTPDGIREAFIEKPFELKANIPQYFYYNMILEPSIKKLLFTVLSEEGTELLVSSTTGKPSEQNYAYKGNGKNATVEFERSGEFLYIRIKSTKDTKAMFAKTPILSSVGVSANDAGDIWSLAGNLPIVVSEIRIGSTLNITIEVEFPSSYPDKQFALCYALDQSITNPTIYNANQVVYSSTVDYSRTKASIIIRNVQTTFPRISFYKPYCGIHVELFITVNVINQ